MKKQKYYVVIRGKVRGIFLTWEDCKDSVSGYPNASYKSFEDPKEAIDFLVKDLARKEDGDIVKDTKQVKDNFIKIKNTNASNLEIKNEKKNTLKEENIDIKNTKNQYMDKNDEKNHIFGTIEAYIDGSYEHASKTYGSGVVILQDGKILDTISNTGKNPNYVSMRNVAGEIEASILAMKYCIDRGYRDLLIYYDYEGIEKWCTGEWKANKEGTIYYRQFCIEAMKKTNISFKKVKAHSGDKYNDMADKLAKQAVFI